MNSKRWNKLSFIEQMANVGSEVERAISWKNKKNINYSRMSFDRALEFLTLTIEDKKNRDRLKEIMRTYEALNDFFYGDNIFHSNDILWQKYFYNFAYAARNKFK